MLARPHPQQARHRRTDTGRSTGVVSLAPAVIMLNIGFDLGGIHEPVVDTLTGWLTDRADPFPAD